MNSPKQIAENYLTVARGKVTTVWWKTFILAILAGTFIAFGGVLATCASAGLTGVEASLIKGAVFPLGLIMVVLCGSELFTGNCLLLAPVLSKSVKPLPVLKCLGIVYLGNLIGSIFVAVLAVYSGVFGEAARAACVLAAANKSNLTFFGGFIRAIPCNMLVCLAVWASMSSNHTVGKVVALYMPIFAFVVCGFEHSVANMYYLFAGLMADASSISVGGCFINLVSVTLGNIIGGCLIAAAYWAAYLKQPKAPVQKDESKSEENE